MSTFERAIPTVLYHEGRYVDHPCDPGGATNFGISLRFLMQTGDLNCDGWRDGDINQDGVINAEDIKALSEERATELYRIYFWIKNNYGEIEDQAIATKIFDLAVNMGSYSANKVAQQAVRAASGLSLATDGIMGSQTFRGINYCKPNLLMVALKSEAAGYYRSIRYNGSKDFIKGWLNRAYSNVILGAETNGLQKPC